MSDMKQAQIGIIGLAVMGANLARNFANRKVPTAVYNRTTERTEEFIAEHGDDYLIGCFGLEGFVESIAKPRKIILMVKAGEAVDEVLKQLTPLLSKGDIVIDGGNSYFHDTYMREMNLAKKGIHFVGCGISGGEEGALKGPSLMPGGSAAAWKSLKPLLEKIAAKDFGGKPCVTHVGNGPAGHYVKMVHNGIEYGIMQMMAETYQILRDGYGLKAPEIAKIFEKLNKGKLNSFLFSIAPMVLDRKDNLSKGYLIDHILDKAEQKGTGRWTVIQSMEWGIAIPSITEAVYARAISSFKNERVMRNNLFKDKKTKPKMPLGTFVKLLEDGLSAAMFSCYAQGFDLLQYVSDEWKWDLSLSETARIWQGGCIIRATMLKDIRESFGKNEKAAKTKILKALRKELPALRKVITTGIETAIPVASLSASLNYFDSKTCGNGSANFIQGLRDYFGAHTYERTDRDGHFHTEWLTK